MDVLYILGSGSPFNNDELRYSLRSLEKNGVNVSRVIVVGENPGFLSENVEFYPCKEFSGNKEYRIAKKIEWACKKNIVKGDFFFCNDDFFFIKEFDLLTYPFYYKGCLSATAPNPHYNISLQNTFKYLLKLGKSTKHFDVHTPIIYNSNNFLSLEKHWKISSLQNFGFVVKSIYSNIYGIEGEKYVDVKLSRLKTQADFARISKTNCISVSNAGWVNGVKDFITTKFPDKSKYEL
jgi:hypothetical protein